MSFVASPDPRSIAAIVAKRKWLHGEITDAELYVAWDVARDAALNAAMAAARDAASDATWDDAREQEVEILRELLMEGDNQ